MAGSFISYHHKFAQFELTKIKMRLPEYNVPVPFISEPANMFLMGTGLLGLAAIGRRKFFKKH